MHLEYWQIGGLMALSPVAVSLLLLVPKAFQMAAEIYWGIGKAAWAFTFNRSGVTQA